MRLKAPNTAADLPAGTPDLIRAYFEFNHLKHLYRQGWLRRGLPPERCETVAEHTFATALLVMLLCDAAYPGLDCGRALRMALIHDLGEVYAGDFTPADAVTRAEKHHLERAGVAHILGSLPGGDSYQALWDDFEAGHTPEARLVRQVDRLEMALQAAVYERLPQESPLELGEFYASARQALDDPILEQLLESLLQARPTNPAPPE
jgi:putative hydrolases of HD superfamily